MWLYTIKCDMQSSIQIIVVICAVNMLSSILHILGKNVYTGVQFVYVGFK